jgi:hypothetical protein
MAVNPHVGKVPVEIGGETYTLHFTWDAIAKMDAEFGSEGHQMDNPEHLAKIVAFGLQEHHPDMTEEKVRKASPPIQPTVEAVVTALNYAYYGPLKADKGKSKRPREARRLRTSLKRLFGRESAQASSGS